MKERVIFTYEIACHTAALRRSLVTFCTIETFFCEHWRGTFGEVLLGTLLMHFWEFWLGTFGNFGEALLDLLVRHFWEFR